ncbi:hypothetical protein JCM8097_001611 [Rhodosporidiobolus ruineniae]
MLRPRLPLRRLATPLRPLSTTARAAYPPRRAGAGGRGAKPAEEESKVVLDQLGRERRPLPPLGRDGKPLETPPPSSSSSDPPPPAPRARRSRAKKTEEAGEGGEKTVRMTALEKAVREDLARYPDAILLTQVGSFFESYFEQARTVSKVLGIKLTSKVFGKASDAEKTRHAFCGFPLAQLEKHVSVLVQEGHKVVIVEEFKERGDDRIVRKVTRVVTPGTGVDEAFVSIDKPNYVLALGVVEGASKTEEIGMAYRDVSTGASFTRTSRLSSLRDDLRLVAPREVVVDQQVEGTKLGKAIMEVLEGEQRREGLAVSSTSTEAVPSSSTSVRSPVSAAEDVILSYLATTLVTTPPPRRKATFIDPASVMQLDAVTLQSLEIRESLRGGTRGSLLGAVKRTVSPGGLRLLSERLCNPSTELSTINDRLSLVSSFIDGMPHVRQYLASLLRELDDTPRVLQRLALRRPNAANDLLSLKRTMCALEQIRAAVEEAVPLDVEAAQEAGFTEEEHRVVHALLERMGEYRALADEIEAAVDEEALAAKEAADERKAALVAEFGDGAAEREKEDRAVKGGEEEGLWGERQPWVIRADFSTSVGRLHSELLSLRQQAYDLQSHLRTKYTSKNLTLRTVLKVGPGVHAYSKDGLSKLEADPKAVMHQKSGSTRVYVVQEWVDLHRKITAVQENILALEAEAMQVLIARTLERYHDLLQTADALAELDVTLGFAELAAEQGWERPVLDESKSLEIVGGRHPTVENALMSQNRSFDPNDVAFFHPDDNPKSPSLIHVVTGPNMAGKSTYLRQTAIIVLLAQAGSFIPASSARIGICDRIFSRVGARDELDRDRSTFMIEMDEATSILENATSRSLVLLDELGRGTSPLDGVSIAYGALDHLTHTNRCRTLFATHFHALGALLEVDEKDPLAKGKWEGVEFWCTDVVEEENAVRFPHSIRRGLNVDSGGLTIARLAGMPAKAVLSAMEVRERLRKRALEL